jgi:hypothetical protein
VVEYGGKICTGKPPPQNDRRHKKDRWIFPPIRFIHTLQILRRKSKGVVEAVAIDNSRVAWAGGYSGRGGLGANPGFKRPLGLSVRWTLV